MRRFIPLTLVLLAIPAMACSFGRSGDDGEASAETGSTSRSYPVTGFTGVDVQGADSVAVQVGSGFSIRAEGPASELDTMRIERSGDTLRIGRQRRGGNWVSRGRVKVFVTMPRITDAGVSGSGSLTIDQVTGPHFGASVAGSGSLGIGALRVEHADFSIAGSGGLRASGTADMLNLNIAGSGSVAASALRAKSAKVSIAGSGSVTARVEGPATVSIMGSGDVDLGPAARCTTRRMGSGRARCGS